MHDQDKQYENPAHNFFHSFSFFLFKLIKSGSRTLSLWAGDTF